VVDQINSGQRSIYFHGFIQYRGVHLSDGDAMYITRFRYKWVPQHGLYGSGGYWEKSGLPEENQET
ncbi:MAG: hypothetical protein ACRD4Y_14875, partial [Candidatus Acidiferrales bacterium]